MQDHKQHWTVSSIPSILLPLSGGTFRSTLLPWICLHGCDVAWLPDFCLQDEGTRGHGGGLVALGAPQRGRPASPQLQSHLDVSTHTDGAQTLTRATRTHAYSLQQQAHTANTPARTRAGEKGKQQQSDSGGKQTFYVLICTKLKNAVID